MTSLEGFTFSENIRRVLSRLFVRIAGNQRVVIQNVEFFGEPKILGEFTQAVVQFTMLDPALSKRFLSEDWLIFVSRRSQLNLHARIAIISLDWLTWKSDGIIANFVFWQLAADMSATMPEVDAVVCRSAWITWLHSHPTEGTNDFAHFLEKGAGMAC